MVILMEEEKVKKRNIQNSSNKSKVLKNKSTKKKGKKAPSLLSNEELLEQILNKKKKKKEVVSKTKEDLLKLKEINTRSSEEILDEILSKKRRKKAKGVVPSTEVLYTLSVKTINPSIDEILENKHDVDNHILLQEIIEEVKKEELQARENEKFFFKKRVFTVSSTPLTLQPTSRV